MPERLILTEYVATRDVELPTGVRDLLSKAFPELTISPTVGAEGRYDITPGASVGVAELSGLTVEVRPKIRFDRLLFVLSYALDPAFWEAIRTVDLGDADSIVEAVVPSFVHHVRRAFQRGVLVGYRATDETAMTVRGRIRFGDQIRRRYGLLLPVEISYDEFTEDILENRLIKAAIGRLRRMSLRSERSRLALREFDTALELVMDQPYEARAVPVVSFNRVNAHYRPAVELARLVLRYSSIELGSGGRSAVSFVVDMNEAFENFVVVALREALRLSYTTFPQNARGRQLNLDTSGSIGLEPDFSWWNSGRCLFVGDAKYKRLSIAGFKHPDIYQMLAYMTAADLRAGLLVYAEGTKPTIEHHLVDGRQVTVAALDLSKPPDVVLQEVRVLSRFIREHRLAGATAA